MPCVRGSSILDYCHVCVCSSIASLVQSVLASLSKLENDGWDERAIGSAAEHVAKQCGVGKGKVLAALRAGLTGNKVQQPWTSWSHCMLLNSSDFTGTAWPPCGRSGSSSGSEENTAAAVESAALSKLCHLWLHEPSLQPCSHLSCTLLQSNCGFPSLSLTSLCRWHIHRVRAGWLEVFGGCVFNLEGRKDAPIHRIASHSQRSHLARICSAQSLQG